MISRKEFLTVNKDLIEKLMKDYDLDDFSVNVNGHQHSGIKLYGDRNSMSFSFNFTKADFEGLKNELKADKFSDSMSNLLNGQKKPSRRKKK